jgi:lipopolysaccharide export system protein LptA
LNNITKIYDIKLVTSTGNNITYEASNQILKIKGTGDLTFDGQTDKVQLLIVLYKNENVYVVFASKTEENLFNSFLIHGNIVESKFDY